MMLEVDMQAFVAEWSNGATVVDVREPDEFEIVRVPGARLIPLGELSDAVAQLDRADRIFVICASGNRSLRAAEWLCSRGYDALSVAGGTSAWVGAGFPVDEGPGATG